MVAIRWYVMKNAKNSLIQAHHHEKFSNFSSFKMHHISISGIIVTNKLDCSFIISLDFFQFLPFSSK